MPIIYENIFGQDLSFSALGNDQIGAVVMLLEANMDALNALAEKNWILEELHRLFDMKMDTREEKMAALKARREFVSEIYKKTINTHVSHLSWAAVSSAVNRNSGFAVLHHSTFERLSIATVDRSSPAPVFSIEESKHNELKMIFSAALMHYGKLYGAEFAVDDVEKPREPPSYH